jgi:hypothetical protein
VHHLFIDFKNAYDSARREVMYNILPEFAIPMELQRSIELCLHGTCSRARVGKLLFDMFPTKKGLKAGDALSPLLFNFTLVYVIRRVPAKEKGLKLHNTHNFLVYANDVNPLGVTQNLF